MARNAKDERKLQEEDKRRTEKKKRERAPLVCFVRAQAFERSGVQRFTVRTLPADMCTHIIYSYLETDNNTGEFMFRKRGQRGDMGESMPLPFLTRASCRREPASQLRVTQLPSEISPGKGSRL
ncbi:hypothetical protein V5799_013266 [Amblyomma americanum]|uniref:Uncharacterized protein n=1 Tax=Amblyomma americanum TaxID=6943 RepID=A0AAQ4E6D4_AMBAM